MNCSKHEKVFHSAQDEGGSLGEIPSWQFPSVSLSKMKCGGGEITFAALLLARLSFRRQISRITGIIIGLRPVVFWIRRFSSDRTFSLTVP